MSHTDVKACHDSVMGLAGCEEVSGGTASIGGGGERGHTAGEGSDVGQQDRGGC